MTESKKKAGSKEREKKTTERRTSQRFAWLGPMMERRKTKPEPVSEPAADKEPEAEKE